MSLNALNVYVSTCRLALHATTLSEEAEVPEASTDDAATSHAGNSWTELFRLLPCLRQALTCVSCGEIAVEPVGQHSTSCRQCAAKNASVNPSSCEQTVQVQGKILVQCYRKLCQYLENTNFYRKLGNSSANGGTRRLADLIREGAAIKEDAQSVQPFSSRYVSGACNSKSTSGVLNFNIKETLGAVANGLIPLPSSNLYSVSLTGNHSTRITIKRKQHSQDDDVVSSSSSSSSSTTSSSTTTSSDSDSTPPVKMPNKVYKKVTKVMNNKRLPYRRQTRNHNTNRSKANNVTILRKRRGCRCGNAALRPGKMTCHGQRCPCYVKGFPCDICKCRGCNNPRKRESSSSSCSSSSSSSTSSSDVPLHHLRATNKSSIKNANNDAEDLVKV